MSPPPSLSFPHSQFHGGPLKASDGLRPKCPNMKWSRERREEHAGVFTDVKHCSHCGTVCVCTAARENEVCHCHPSTPSPRQQSHVLVYSAVSTFGAILRSVITHLWQRSGELMRNEWNQGRHRPAPTGMDGSAKRNKLLEMQPRQAITAAPHTVLLKAGPRMHASPTSRVWSTIITDCAYYSCVWWASTLEMYICTGARLQMGCFVPRSAGFLFNV